MIFHDADHRLKSLPTGWTSRAPADPFLMAAGSRSYFHIADLLTLTQLIRTLTSDRP